MPQAVHTVRWNEDVDDETGIWILHVIRISWVAKIANNKVLTKMKKVRKQISTILERREIPSNSSHNSLKDLYHW